MEFDLYSSQLMTGEGFNCCAFSILLPNYLKQVYVSSGSDLITMIWAAGRVNV